MLKQTHTMNTIKVEQIRELHKTILNAYYQVEQLQKQVDQDSITFDTLVKLGSNIDNLIFNGIFDVNDLLFDETLPYEPIKEEELS